MIQVKIVNRKFVFNDDKKWGVYNGFLFREKNEYKNILFSAFMNLN